MIAHLGPHTRCLGWPTLIGALLLLGCCASTPAMRTRSTDEEADARALLVEEHYTLAPDGAQTRRQLVKTKIYTEYAVDDLGDPRLVHDRATQTLEVLRADTFMRDGTKVSIQPNSVNETMPDALAAAPAYASLRETVVTHVGMEVGCTNLLEHEVRGKPSARPLWAEVPLHLPYPTEQKVVAVTVPAGSTLLWSCLGCTVTPTQQAVAGGTEHRFAFADLRALNLGEADHGGRPPFFGQPRLVFSTATSWKALDDELARRFAGASKPDDAIRARAAELTERLATDEQRLLALWRFVADNIQTVSWPLDELGHAPTAAGVVLERSYGHSLDKAALLASLLEAAGITAVPALVSRDSLLARKVPTLAPFDEAWLIVDLDGELRWISPAAVATGQGLDRLEGRWALPLIDRSQKRMPFLIAKTPYALGEPVPIQTGAGGVDRNRSVLVATLTPDGSGAVKGEFDVTLLGIYNPFLEVDPDGGAAKVAGGLLASLDAGSWRSDCEGCRTSVRKFAADSSLFGLTAQGESGGLERVLELRLPWAPRSQLLTLDLHRGQRQTPLALGSRGEERAVVKIAIPEGYELRSKLPEGEVRNEVGQLVTRATLEGETLTIERTLRLERRVVEPEAYPALRALADELWRADGRSVLLVKKEKAPGA